jgi:hypothetical protein
MKPYRFPEASSLPPPNGSSDDWRYLTAGRQLAHDAGTNLEALLKTDTSNLALRLELLGFYGEHEKYQKQFLKQVLWMIEERPKDYITYCLKSGIARYKLNFSKNFLEKANAIWNKHTKSDLTNAMVLCNAASFYESIDWARSQRLYSRAKRIDPQLALPWRRLAYLYRYHASIAPKIQKKKLIAKALLEANRSIGCRKEHSGERIGVYVEFTPTAIKAGDYKLARKFANRLNYYSDSDFYIWAHFARLYLSWLDLKQERWKSLNSNLKQLKNMFKKTPSHVACGTSAVAFVRDAIQSREIGLAQYILKILMVGSKQKVKETEELEEWLKAISENREPKLDILQKKLDHPL